VAKTLAWAVVLLVLAAFYYTYEIQGGQKRQEEASKRELLFSLLRTMPRASRSNGSKKRCGLRSAMGIGISRNRWQHAAMTKNTVN
jgi:hypothetical protein